MAMRRSVLLNGLWLVLRRPGALVWAYVFNLVLALVFAMRLGAQLGGVMDHSLAAESLSHGFDVATLVGALFRLNEGVPGTGVSGYAGVAMWGLVYFLLMPGALVMYQIKAPGKLSSLLMYGLLYFWRTVRIWLLMAIVSLLVLGPLLAVQTMWSKHVDATRVGWPAVWQVSAGWVIVFLVAALLRLYFDLVGVYTAQIGMYLRWNSTKPDRRVRRTLLPALRVLFRNFFRLYGTFLLLTLLGVAAVGITTRWAVLAMAQPRVWPIFVLVQVGMFVNLLTRFWQRGAETILSLDFPLQPEGAPKGFDSGSPSKEPDPIPNPEPAVPALAGPDDGVFEGA